MKSFENDITGKSLVFNIVFILLNLTGLTFLVLGYHNNFESNALLFKILGYGLMIIGLIAIGIFKGWLLFAYFSRVLVGGLFIVSGLIKANDLKGFSYKLEEYFEDGALAYRIKEWFSWETFSLEFLIQHALLLSIIICVLEIILGVLAIIGMKIKTTTWLMLGMMVFFTFLTWHTKECDPNTTFKDVDTYAMSSSIANIKINQAEHDENITILSQNEESVTVAEMKKPQCVDDCGCFGDAMKGSFGRSLSPSESFWKDLVLLYLVVIIFISRRRIKQNSNKENIIMLFGAFLFIAFFSWLFTWGFPIFFGLGSLLLALWIKRAGGKLLGNDWGAILMITVLSGIFVTYVLMYLPLRDYRPYHEGSNLIEKMNNGEKGIFETVYVYHNKETKQDSTIKTLDSLTIDIWQNKGTWEWKETQTKTIKETKLPSITDQFNPKVDLTELTATERSFPYIAEALSARQAKYIDVIKKETGERYPQLAEEFWAEDWDTTDYVIGDTLMKLDPEQIELSLLDYILSEDQLIIVLSRDIKTGDFSRISRLKEIAKKAAEKNIPMVMISTATKEDIIKFREEYELVIPTFLNDETELKAITRSNPTLMILQDATVVGKFAFRSTPSWDWLVKNTLKLE